MAKEFAISEVAHAFGLRTSAIRYYERIGILPPALRKNGRRRYQENAFFRLAVIQRARETGFTLDEIRRLFFGFGSRKRPSHRWRELSRQKSAELEERAERLRAMQILLKRMKRCDCHALEECGKRLLSSRLAEDGRNFVAKTKTDSSLPKDQERTRNLRRPHS
jgi:MerR family transcriptional regulator, redox-sensitive transcriptional activator SoxR